MVVSVAVPDIDGFDDIEPIGRGGAATVYRARQLAMGGRDVAIKLMNGADVEDGARLRFERECAAAGRLSWHPHVISVYDAGSTTDGDLYLVMEYHPAGTLGDRVRRDRGLPVDKVVQVGVAIADALRAAHAVGLLHRDVKPSNILVGPKGSPVLTDFGLAVVEGYARSKTGTFSATIAHASPEVLGGARADVQSEIYSFGSTLYTLASGAPPYESADDSSLLGLVERVTRGEPPPPPTGGADPDLDAAVLRAIAKNPQDRWPDAATMGEALQASR
jgi:serine/threonine protein kinase